MDVGDRVQAGELAPTTCEQTEHSPLCSPPHAHPQYTFEQVHIRCTCVTRVHSQSILYLNTQPYTCTQAPSYKWPKLANTQPCTHMCEHTQRRDHRRRTRVHRQGVNVSTNAMWSPRAREFLTPTAGSHCQEAPVLTLPAHAHPCPHRLAPQTRAERRHVQTWEHACVSRDTQAHMQMTHRFVCAQLCLGAHPPTPTARPQLPKGPWDRVPVSPLSGAPILPSPCSFQLALSPETDLGISGPRF